MSILKVLLSIILWIFPWFIRRPLLNTLFGYEISKQARIGFSIIIPDHLEMSEGARIGHLTVCKGIFLLKLGISSSIGNLNWITGDPQKGKNFFTGKINREPKLVIENQASITNRDLID